MYDDLFNLENIELKREHLVLLHTIRTLNELTDMGILQGKPFELTEKADEYLKDFGEPTEKETEWAINLMKAEGYIQVENGPVS